MSFICLTFILFVQFGFKLAVAETFPSVVFPSFARPDIKGDIVPLTYRYLIVERTDGSKDSIRSNQIFNDLSFPKAERMFDYFFFEDVISNRKSALHSHMVKVVGQDGVNRLYDLRYRDKTEQTVENIVVLLDERLSLMLTDYSGEERLRAIQIRRVINQKTRETLEETVSNELWIR